MGAYGSPVLLRCPLVPSGQAGQEVLSPLPIFLLGLVTTFLKSKQMQHSGSTTATPNWEQRWQIGSKRIRRSAVGGGQAREGEYPALLGARRRISASICLDDHCVPSSAEHSAAIPKHSRPTSESLCAPACPHPRSTQGLGVAFVVGLFND